MATKNQAAAASTEAIKPDLLPADLGKGDIQFIKRGDYAKRTAETFSLRTKADVKKDHVTQCLEALDKGLRELPGDENPEEFQNLFKIVKEDYEAGQAKVTADKAQEAADALKKEQEEKERAEKEEKLFLAIKDKNPNLGDLAGKFDTGNMDRFIATKEVSNEELLGALNTGLKMGDFSGWMIGDLVNELEKRGQLNVVQRLADQCGIPYSKVYNDCKTAKFVAPDQRRKGVSFTIYREAANAKFTDAQKKEAVPALLKDIEEGKHTTQTVREAVKAIQGKVTAPVLPEENPKALFLIVDPNAELPMIASTAIGFPRELFDNGSIIINPSTRLRFANNGFSKKPENRWVELPKYEKPAAPETPKATPKKKKK